MEKYDALLFTVAAIVFLSVISFIIYNPITPKEYLLFFAFAIPLALKATRYIIKKTII